MVSTPSRSSGRGYCSDDLRLIRALTSRTSDFKVDLYAYLQNCKSFSRKGQSIAEGALIGASTAFLLAGRACVIDARLSLSSVMSLGHLTSSHRASSVVEHTLVYKNGRAYVRYLHVVWSRPTKQKCTS